MKKMIGKDLDLNIVETPKMVQLVDNEGIIVGFYNTAKEALAAAPIIKYNLSRGKVPAKLLKTIPPHCKAQVMSYRQNNKQVTNNNKSFRSR